MKIALIADDLTRISLELEDNVKIYNVTPFNYKFVFQIFKPDFLFVESAWQGYKNTWKYKIASYPDVPTRSNKKLKKVVSYAKDLGIPTIFWNKEDDVHHNRFIDSAILFDYIFTVDINSIPRYQKRVNVPINLLMFAVQPKIHHFTGFNFQYKKVNFVGSFSRHIHTKRREWQEMFFNTICKEGYEIDVFNRNSNRNPSIYGYPKLKCLNEFPKLSYFKTPEVYKNYLISLNVNTITNSMTMFSRRLIEILACGGVCVTNPSLAVETLFKDYCYIMHTEKEFSEFLNRVMNYGLTYSDYQKLEAASEYVLSRHTWKHRLDDIVRILNLV